MEFVELKENDAAQVDRLARNNLLQSWQWLEFQKGANQKTRAFGLREENELKAAVVVINHKLPFNSCYFFIPRGPMMPLAEKDWLMLCANIAEIGKDENALFLRVEPYVEQKNLPEIFQKGTWEVRKAKRNIHPALTWITNLNKSEEELLSGMHPKTRYNLRLAEKKGIEIISETNPEKIDEFYKILEATAHRNKFSPHPRSYYSKELEVLGKHNNALLLSARYQGKTIAAILISFFGGQAVYLHGATDYEHRSLMAPYLLHWKALKEAKKRGCTSYDWHGIVLDKKHPWAGISRFKQGFPGKEVNYPGSYDIIFSPILYQAYRFAQKG